MNSLKEIDRAVVKSVLKEIIQEQPDILREIVKEILIENQFILSSEQTDRRKKLEQFINEDFNKYSSVFKALA